MRDEWFVGALVVAAVLAVVFIDVIGVAECEGRTCHIGTFRFPRSPLMLGAVGLAAAIVGFLILRVRDVVLGKPNAPSGERQKLDKGRSVTLVLECGHSVEFPEGLAVPERPGMRRYCGKCQTGRQITEVR